MDQSRTALVQDYTRKEAPDIAVENYTWSVADLRKAFRNKSSCFNVLDIDAPGYTKTHKPQAMQDIDLLGTSIAPAGSIGRGLSKDGTYLGRFFLLARKGAISGIHSDSGGIMTWLRPMVGREVWYYGRTPYHLTEGDRNRWEHEGDLESSGYENPWNRIVLERGDTFIMPPGVARAVFAPEDALCVGGFILTHAQVRQFMFTVRHQQRHDALKSDDSSAQLFHAYKAHLETLLRKGRKHECENMLWELEAFAAERVPENKDYKEINAKQEAWVQEWMRFLTM